MGKLVDKLLNKQFDHNAIFNKEISKEINETISNGLLNILIRISEECLNIEPDVTKGYLSDIQLISLPKGITEEDINPWTASCLKKIIKFCLQLFINMKKIKMNFSLLLSSGDKIMNNSMKNNDKIKGQSNPINRPYDNCHEMPTFDEIYVGANALVDFTWQKIHTGIKNSYSSYLTYNWNISQYILLYIFMYR